MKRRTLLAALAAAAVALPPIAGAQSRRKLPAVGFLSTGGGSSLAQFRAAMRELGYVEGSTIVIEPRTSSGNPDALPALAAELVGLNVDVVYVTGPPAVRAARDATRTIPIVALDLETDPVQSGLVSSLAQPGGNITGLFLDAPALAGKWLELLDAAAPGRRRIGLLWDATTGTRQLDAAKVAAAQRPDRDLRIIEYRNAEELESGIREASRAGVNGIILLSSPMVSAASKRLAELTMRYRLPAISPFRAFADEGGFISYGPNLLAFRRFAATYVHRILKGAKPGELPIQQPTTFELVINAKAARALKITVPQTLLLRADAVIQ
jgi:putative ABC transport system substrate-binding protein